MEDEKMIEELSQPKPEMDYTSMAYHCHEFVVLRTEGEFEILMCKDCGCETTRKISDIQDNIEEKGMTR